MDADLRDVLNRYYYDATVCDLRHLSKTGQGELSYNSVMYLDVISYQEEMLQEGCTVGSLAKTLRISNSAATMKVQELVRLGACGKRAQRGGPPGAPPSFDETGRRCTESL